MKKTAAIILAGTLCVFGIAARAASDAVIKEIRAQLRPDFTIVVDGEVKEFRNAQGETVYPILYDGTTYLPVRSTGELLDKDVYWYENEKRIELNDKKDATVTDADVIIHGNEERDTVKETEDDREYIGKDKALAIALEKAGISEKDAVFTKVKLDRDDGVYVYEVEFRSGRTEYEAEIRAEDGKVLSFEKDIDD